MNNIHKVCIIGLGYVGLPLAVEFSKKYKTVGFDINSTRIEELKNNFDKTLEVSSNQLKQASELFFTSTINEIKECNIFIVTVPTPVDKYNTPDLTPLIKASETVGKVLKKDDIVIYESTVYPGTTEEECVPILERFSGLSFNKDFFAGYSPERINPGDKEHTVSNILKVTSGSTPEIADIVNNLYDSIITAGTFKASSIRVAEAAKVIENSQRDINIAFVNELSKIFNLLGIDTQEVLAAAGTKWNFLKFSPGLVGGHCIGVDPYYLAHKAQELGYHPEIILAGRRLNDSMGSYIADETIKKMVRKGITCLNSNVLVLGFTFKENCPDVRNTRVIDIVKELYNYKTNVFVIDPWANKDEVMREYNLCLYNTTSQLPISSFEAIILAVSHDEFKQVNINQFKKDDQTVIIDIKSILNKADSDFRL